MTGEGRDAPLNARPGWQKAALFAVKSFHSLAFFVIQSCIVYLAYSGIRRRTGRGAAVAAGIALAESAVYAGNGFRCPLTGLAERLGAEHGSDTDIFLPGWLAANVARIYTPLLLLGFGLHVHNLRSRRAERRSAAGHAGPISRHDAMLSV
jgi:hypothetical protein